jgi:DNA-binding protein HU-beta
MTKAELIGKVAADAKISKAAAAKVLGSFIDAVKSSLKKGDKVTLIGFGSFSVSQRKARKGRNPQTGKAIKISAKKVPKFSAGKAFKEAVMK